VPTSHRTSDYAILIVLGALLVGVVVLLVSLGWVQDESQRRDWRRTTHSPGRQGLLAFYLLCERLDYDVQRVDRPLLDDALADVDVLFMIDPLVEVNTGEVAALARWMQAGGVLVCAGGEPSLPYRVHRIGDARSATRAFDAWRFERFGTEPATRSVPARAQGLPLAVDVTDTRLLTDAALYLRADGAAEAVDVLFEDTAGVRVASRPAGAGRAVRAADASFLVNRTLGKADNAVLAMNLVAYAAERAHGGRIAFDEYHGGFGRAESGWSILAGLLVTTPAGWSVLALTAAAGLYLVYRGRRFGTRRPPPRPHRRSKLEYVESVGATYRAVGARRLTLRLVYEWFRRRAAAQAGTDASAPSEEVCRRLAPGDPETAARYAATFAACEAALQAAHLGDRHFAALLERLARIETEALHGRRQGE
jgi:hypothetical protein